MAGTSDVRFGGEAATALAVVSDTEVTVTVPSHAAGAVAVRVATPGGTSGATTYTYQ